MSTIANTDISAPAGRRPWLILTRPGVGLLLFLVIISIVGGILQPTFLQVENWTNMGNQMVFTVILGVGMTLVLIGGGIDLSVGAVVGLSGAVVAWLLAQNVPLVVALIVGILTGTGVGALNGLVITRLKLPDFIATLAVMAIMRGLLQAWTVGIPFLIYASNAYRSFAGLTPVVGRVTIPILIAAAVTLFVWALLRYTILGRRIRASGSNREAAALAGVRVSRVKLIIYVMSGTLAGIVGVMIAGRLGTVEPTLGTGFEVSAIAAAVMGGAALTGGKGSVFGAVVGAVTLTVIQNLINLFNVSPAWSPFVLGVVILIAVGVDRLSSAANKLAGTRGL